MKINQTKKDDQSAKKTQNINDIFYSLQEQYNSVYIKAIEDEIFIYRPIGRKEWCDVANNSQINEFERQEIVCRICTLYPEDYDFSTCVAGIPTALYNDIIECSYLTLEDMINMISYYRQDTQTINANITCIINEAFPNFDLEEIENWDMEKTIKYFARAEWKLINLRKIDFDEDILDLLESKLPQKENAEKMPADTTEIEGTKTKLTPEKLAELKKRYPEIDWAHDSSLEHE